MFKRDRFDNQEQNLIVKSICKRSLRISFGHTLELYFYYYFHSYNISNMISIICNANKIYFWFYIKNYLINCLSFVADFTDTLVFQENLG